MQLISLTSSKAGPPAERDFAAPVQKAEPDNAGLLFERILAASPNEPDAEPDAQEAVPADEAEDTSEADNPDKGDVAKVSTAEADPVISSDGGPRELVKLGRDSPGIMRRNHSASQDVDTSFGLPHAGQAPDKLAEAKAATPFTATHAIAPDAYPHVAPAVPEVDAHVQPLPAGPGTIRPGMEGAVMAQWASAPAPRSGDVQLVAPAMTPAPPDGLHVPGTTLVADQMRMSLSAHAKTVQAAPVQSFVTPETDRTDHLPTHSVKQPTLDLAQNTSSAAQAMQTPPARAAHTEAHRVPLNGVEAKTVAQNKRGQAAAPLTAAPTDQGQAAAPHTTVSSGGQADAIRSFVSAKAQQASTSETVVPAKDVQAAGSLTPVAVNEQRAEAINALVPAKVAKATRASGLQTPFATKEGEAPITNGASGASGSQTPTGAATLASQQVTAVSATEAPSAMMLPAVSTETLRSNPRLERNAERDTPPNANAAQGRKAAPAQMQQAAAAAITAEVTKTKSYGIEFPLVSEAEITSVIADPKATTAQNTSVIAPTRTTDTAAHVVRQIADAMQGRTDRAIEVSLSPEELGRVRMTISTGEGVVTLGVVADRPETLDLLRRHIDLLSAAFEDMGFNEMTFSFAHGSDPQEQDGGAAAMSDDTPLPTGGDASADTPVTRLTLGDLSGLDLRF
ncbi:MAG: flagellar hook-length control protein FliK [Pseudomonadota bacterium]